MLRFQDTRVIVCHSKSHRYSKDILLLDIISVWKELVVALKGIVVAVCTLVKDLAFCLV